MAEHTESVIVISSEEDEPAPRTGSAADSPAATVGIRGLWGQRQDCGECRGSNQLPCCFGPNGHAAMAGLNGRCDLCSGEIIEMLHATMQQRLTHLIANLTGKPLEHALVRIKMVLGSEARDMYERRRERALHRRPRHGQVRNSAGTNVNKGSE